MNTSELIEQLAQDHKLPRVRAKRILTSIFQAITESAAKGDEVSISGFGRFKVAIRPEREGRNPTTGQPITIAASKKVVFSPSKPVRELLNA
ncbi:MULTISPECIES: HU family DNA-binding protein [Inquilinus]|jgi:DNA-binding protein HU-beta|uniref:DNA-binding protein HU-beta n=1 Tax=Inquilinus ginsengisoli TaxID=363840 RepID=A0ABU1JSW1_9PROT|nr:HU family DNA-binding protein [Inquilinus ginsengisoli]MDR6290670.1 DNA-binding protein HU-beta [Inquilinus ginsengisoli]